MADIDCWSVALIIMIPPLLLVSLIFHSLKKAHEEQKEKEEQLQSLWNRIHIGMTREEVVKILGRPKRIREPTLFRSALRLGPIEEWSYGFWEGKVKFKFGKVVGYTKPS